MSAHSLRLVTWNVWFGAWERASRQAALWAELERLQPDITCLQEVLPEHFDGPAFERRRMLGDWISDERLPHEYDTVMLSRVPVHAFERVPLPTQMGRELLVARLAIDPPLTVATVHLDSKAHNTPTRVRQLEHITAHLADEPDVVLVGDMNFPADPAQPENLPLRGWTDAWVQLHGDEPGYTSDTHINHMRYSIKREHTQRRIDRVFIRSEHWRVTELELLGTTSLPGDPLTFISDHFGLCAQLVSRAPPSAI